MIHVQETLRRKLVGHAAREMELLTIPQNFLDTVTTTCWTTSLSLKVMKEMPPI